MEKVRDWKPFAIGEGLSKTAQLLTQRGLGPTMLNPVGAIFSSGVTGVIQIIIGLTGIMTRNRRGNTTAMAPDFSSVAWPFLFGIVGAVTSIVSILAVRMGADIGIMTFQVTCSIVPGALLGRLFFGDKLNWRQVGGMFVFLVAAWAMLNFPPLTFQTFAKMPAWFWLSWCITLTAAINEVLSRKATDKKDGKREVDEYRNTFWVGISAVACSFAGIVAWKTIFGQSLNVTSTFWLWVLLYGAITTLLVSFKFLAYNVGQVQAVIALKKMVMNGAWLITAIFAGALVGWISWVMHGRVGVQADPLTFGKLVGVGVFFIAFALTNNATWERLTSWSR